jgi:Cu-Zn family superoxide dismutase
MRPFAIVFTAALLGVSTNVHAAGLQAAIALTTPDAPSVGTITITQSGGGAVFAYDLHGLPAGPHGFHIHANGSCAPSEKDGKPVPAGAAGGHLDPAMTGVHAGPQGAGHLGDLPVITVAADGTARGRVVAPRIMTLDDLRGHALMIHAGGDNYADQPAPLGGGGARLACGVAN